MNETPRTMFEKIWDQHLITRRDDGACLLWVDRHFVHEGSFHGFNGMRKRQGNVARPDLTFGIADHYVPTRQNRQKITDGGILDMITQLRSNTTSNAIHLFDLEDPRQGIVHVVGPEQGLIQPGTIVVCGDSHTSTNGAFGAIAFGIGASEVTHVLMTQTIWQKMPRLMRITIDGLISSGVSAKDIALTVIARLGANGATGYVIEYTGTTIRNLSMEARMTLCNMSIEAGARCAMIAPDQTTFSYLQDRPFSPKANWQQAQAYWAILATDEDARFDHQITIDASRIPPTVTWGTSPEDALPIDAHVPRPDCLNQEQAEHLRGILDYMGLEPGQKLTDIEVDQVFIGSCTNSRIEDLRLAAQVLNGRKAIIPGFVSPGSSLVKAQAEQEGLHHIFIEAGLDWVDSGCSMCVGMNGDLVAAGKRCASTTNRNFRGRQGAGSRTHIMSPAMVAAAALTGKLTDVRHYLQGSAA